jgi:hypothetical protein
MHAFDADASPRPFHRVVHRGIEQGHCEGRKSDGGPGHVGLNDTASTAPSSCSCASSSSDGRFSQMPPSTIVGPPPHGQMRKQWGIAHESSSAAMIALSALASDEYVTLLPLARLEATMCTLIFEFLRGISPSTCTPASLRRGSRRGRRLCSSHKG